jgi:methionyl-tRNA formyltransferase
MVMRMQKGLDTGPICLAEAVAIGPDTTAGELHDQIAERGAGLMVRALGALERGTLDCVAQTSDGASYAKKLGKDEGRIDFGKPARAVHDLVRGLSPFPGAWFEAGPEGKRERIKVLRTALAGGAGLPGVVLDDNLAVACGEGAVRLLELQRAGKKPMRADELLRGFPLARGAQL